MSTAFWGVSHITAVNGVFAEPETPKQGCEQLQAYYAPVFARSLLYPILFVIPRNKPKPKITRNTDKTSNTIKKPTITLYFNFV